MIVNIGLHAPGSADIIIQLVVSLGTGASNAMRHIHGPHTGMLGAAALALVG
jgi:hypothetical protein